MNIILFTPEEKDQRLPLADPRAQHLLKILKIKTGDLFDAGIINGLKGKAQVTEIGVEGLTFKWGDLKAPLPLFPLELLVGFTRPPCARRVLREATSLGVGRISVVGTAKGEASYRNSRLWQNGQYRQHLLEGAQQAFCTRLPQVACFANLEAYFAAHEMPGAQLKIALDNYADLAFTAISGKYHSLCLAVGAERGWSEGERELFRHNGFTLRHMGQRVLRTDTACIAAVSLGLLFLA